MNDQKPLSKAEAARRVRKVQEEDCGLSDEELRKRVFGTQKPASLVRDKVQIARDTKPKGRWRR